MNPRHRYLVRKHLWPPVDDAASTGKYFTYCRIPVYPVHILPYVHREYGELVTHLFRQFRSVWLIIHKKPEEALQIFTSM